MDAWDIAAVAFFGSILAFVVAWRLLAAWSRWYLRERERDMRRIQRIERQCERIGSQAEFYRRFRAGAK